MNSKIVVSVIVLVAISTAVIGCAFSTDSRIQALAYLPAIAAAVPVRILINAILDRRDARHAR